MINQMMTEFDPFRGVGDGHPARRPTTKDEPQVS
jgi:hypothetical protein